MAKKNTNQLTLSFPKIRKAKKMDPIEPGSYKEYVLAVRKIVSCEGIHARNDRYTEVDIRDPSAVYFGSVAAIEKAKQPYLKSLSAAAFSSRLNLTLFVVDPHWERGTLENFKRCLDRISELFSANAYFGGAEFNPAFGTVVEKLRCRETFIQSIQGIPDTKVRRSFVTYLRGMVGGSYQHLPSEVALLVLEQMRAKADNFYLAMFTQGGDWREVQRFLWSTKLVEKG